VKASLPLVATKMMLTFFQPLRGTTAQPVTTQGVRPVLFGGTSAYVMGKLAFPFRYDEVFRS
jgi:hypothetical protein